MLNPSKYKVLTCLTLCLLLFIGKPSWGQDLFYSKEEQFNFQQGKYRLVGSSGSNIYTFLETDKDYFLYAYNDSMALTAKIALDFLPQRILDIQFINYPHQIVTLFQAEARNYIIQYVALIDDKGLLAQEPMAIDSVRSSWFGNNKGFFKFQLSSNKSKIMIYAQNKGKLRTSLISHDGQLIRNRSYNMSTRGMEEGSTALTNQGDFYFLAQKAVGVKKYFNEANLFLIDGQEGLLNRRKLPLRKNTFISGAKSKLNLQNNQLLIAGFHSESKNGNIQGICHLTYDPAQANFSALQKTSFPQELLQASIEKNKKKAFNNEQVQELILKNDGGFLVVAEKAYVTRQTAMAPGWGYYSWYYSPAYANRSIYEYHYKDLLLMDFDANQDLSWQRLIPKDQYSQDDQGIFSSFGFLNTGATLLFIYNDFNNRRNEIKVAALSPNQELQIQALNVGNIGSGDWIPRKAKSLSAKSCLVPVLNRNLISFVKINF